MKKAFTTLVLLAVAQFGWSQIEMKLKPRFSLKDSDTIFVSRPPFFGNNYHLLNIDSSQFSHSTVAGLVYISHQDGMPCLKPDTTFVYNIPILTTSGDGVILNGYRTGNGLIYLKKKY